MLFSTKRDIQWEYTNDTEAKLTNQEREDFEAELSDSELANALLGMANAKSPGPDGLTAEFF